MCDVCVMLFVMCICDVCECRLVCVCTQACVCDVCVQAYVYMMRVQACVY